MPIMAKICSTCDNPVTLKDIFRGLRHDLCSDCFVTWARALMSPVKAPVTR